MLEQNVRLDDPQARKTARENPLSLPLCYLTAVSVRSIFVEKLYGCIYNYAGEAKKNAMHPI